MNKEDILLCANPKCGNTFIRNRRKKFCTYTCNKKVYRKLYKDTEHGRAMIEAGQLRAKIKFALG